MSRLMYKSYIAKFGDSLVAEFSGTPIETLGQALNHFNVESLERAKRLSSGEIPGVPEVISEHAKKMLTMSLPERSNKFSILQTEEGFEIWPGEGPDMYYLVD